MFIEQASGPCSYPLLVIKTWVKGEWSVNYRFLVAKNSDSIPLKDLNLQNLATEYTHQLLA